MVIKHIPALILFSVSLLIPGLAYSQEACEVVQITNGDLSSGDPAVCGNGNGILFISRADLLNNGHPDQEDLFFADITDPFNPVFYQLTNTPQNERGPSISDDCREIGFNSNSDLTGGNPGNLDQMFYADISNPNVPVFTQLTGVSPSSVSGAVSGNGTKVAISTAEDLTGMNPDGSREYFIFDSDNAVVPFGQLTNDPTNSGSITSSPIIDANGSRVVFTSSQDFVPPGTNLNGGRQLLLSRISYDSPNPPNSQLFQLTDFPSNDFFAQGPAITPDGNKILFATNANITGGNPDGNQDLFLVDATNPASPVFNQITRSTEFTSSGGIINSNASLISFITANPHFTFGGEQILLADIIDPIHPEFTILTNFPVGSDLDDLASPNQFTFIAFESDSDLIPGGNTDENNEIYILFPDDCGFLIRRNAIPTLSEWGLIAMTAVLGIIGVLAVRRRNAAA
ncbi:MAG: IPTL-CTERM sorting domain-containing protein [Thermodesulfobacteriota bacterium]